MLERTIETMTDFRAIRAKFQEEITSNLVKSKPIVPEKPRQIPPPPHACPSLLSTIMTEYERDSPVLARTIFKNGKSGILSKRPVSYPLPLPPCTPSLFNGKTTEKEEIAKQTLKDKRLPGPGNTRDKEQKLSMSMPINSCLAMEKTSLPPKSASPKTRGIAHDASSPPGPVNRTVSSTDMAVPFEGHSVSPSYSSETPSTSLSDDDRACVYSQSTTLQRASGKHSPVSRIVSVWAANSGSPQAVSPTQLSLKGHTTGYENQKDGDPQKANDQPQSTSVSAIAAKLNMVSHWKTQHSHKHCVDSGTIASQLGCQRETAPPEIPLLGLESLGPRPDKPLRPPLVDLSPFWAASGKTQHESGLGTPESAGLDHRALEHPMFSKPLNLVYPEFSEMQTAALKAPVCPGDQGLGGTEFEPSVPKSSILEALGLWTRGPASVPEHPNRAAPDPIPACVTEPQQEDVKPRLGSERHSENAGDIYEDVDTSSKFRRGQNTWRRKGIPKNPYADIEVMYEDSRKSLWFLNPWFNVTGELHGDGDGRKELRESHEDKEQKKRRKKEQREREKKENEMRRKFKVNGQEEPMYKAKVTVASKGRKGDLPVQTGDIVSIIRTTDCPKGKWLARDANHKYGYIPVMNVELDIKEMLELGKRASQAAGRVAVEGDTVSEGSRSSYRCAIHSSSYSEEWTCDEESISSSDMRPHNQTAPMAEMFFANGKAQHAPGNGGSKEGHAHSARHEALLRLATFFQQQENGGVAAEDGQAPPNEQEVDFHLTDWIILPPPAAFADRE